METIDLRNEIREGNSFGINLSYENRKAMGTDQLQDSIRSQECLGVLSYGDPLRVLDRKNLKQEVTNQLCAAIKRYE